mgnify:CR=1 FL=1
MLRDRGETASQSLSVGVHPSEWGEPITGITTTYAIYKRDFVYGASPFMITDMRSGSAYQDKEILIEKVRAILTRREFKLRDLYDLYKLHQAKGLKIKKYGKQIIMKVENYLGLSNNARENLLKTLEELKREGYLNVLKPEIEKDAVLIVEEFDKDKFFEFVESLRRELLELIESEKFAALIKKE